MGRPVVGVVGYELPPVPGGRPSVPVVAVGSRYASVLREFGALPWLLPPFGPDDADLGEWFDRLDGLLLAGGPDLEPGRYGEAKRAECRFTDPRRDAAEFRALQLADEHDLPLLGICRGLQLLNVAAGGTLYQDVPTQVPAALRHDNFPVATGQPRGAITHEITVPPGTRLAEALGEPMAAVNSLHHQAVKDLGRGLRVAALAPDGVVEAVERPGERWVVAVQWHPEELTDQPGMARLFQEFVAACRSRGTGRE